MRLDRRRGRSDLLEAFKIISGQYDITLEAHTRFLNTWWQKFCQTFSIVFTLEPPGNLSPEPSRDIKQWMIDIDFSQQKAEARLGKLNVSKSVGPDNIHPRVLKELKGVMSLPLSLIFQTSYASGIVPY